MLKISPNGRFLVHGDGSPFFYLADTAWELFHRPTLAEAQYYLEDRAAKGFTAIQCVALAEFDGLLDPTPEGYVPLSDNDPTRPQEDYFQRMDQIIGIGNALGLVMAVLPTWGDKWNKRWGVGPEIFTPQNAYAYGLFLGRRYKQAEIIWVMGGDRPIETPQHLEIMRAMAQGIGEGEGDRHLMTYHPCGATTSAQYVHDEPWLDFNMWQTGHARNRESDTLIGADYARTPVKPCMDGEPGYEDHAANFDMQNGYLDDYDCRKSFYWATFAGACGHTYGCHPIWQFASYRRPMVNFTRRTWAEARDLPGSRQMRHGMDLLLSRPYLSRIPEAQMILSQKQPGTHRVVATRDTSWSYAMVYIPSQQKVTLDLSRLSGAELDLWWFDPRTGNSRLIERTGDRSPREFTPPTGGPDWVLVIDDVSRSFARPGQA